MTEGLTTCLDPGRGWTITSGGWRFLKKQECWEGHKQALIATIWKETEGTEESAPPSVSDMSAPPFFQSDLLFWGGKEGLTVVIWESLSEQENESWLEEANTMHDWVLWCWSKKEAEEIRSFEFSGKKKSSLTMN